MFVYDVYSDSDSVTIELSDYPDKMIQCLNVIFTLYLNSQGLDTKLNEEMDAYYKTEKFVTPEDIKVVEGRIEIQGNDIFN